MPDATGKLARWRIHLVEMDFEVAYRAGIKNQAADALSRLEAKGEDDKKLTDDLPVLIAHTRTDSESDGEIFSTEEQVDHLVAQRVADEDEPMALVLEEEERQVDGIPLSPTIDEFLGAHQTERFY